QLEVDGSAMSRLENGSAWKTGQPVNFRKRSIWEFHPPSPHEVRLVKTSSEAATLCGQEVRKN
ncbi:MAG: hypothetical protein KAG97_02350, partial [Victivallales bacterium]|nr:hypothetical protein [Victivallales bacterium]